MNIKRPEYGLSEKYLARLRKDTILNLLIIFMFWLVFNVLFKDHPKYGIIKVLFVFVFLAIAVAVTIMNAKRVRKAETIGFTLTKDALLIVTERRPRPIPGIILRRSQSMRTGSPCRSRMNFIPKTACSWCTGSWIGRKRC